MKMFLISDNQDTYTGMRLAGIEGVVAHERAEIEHVLKEVLSDSEIGILLVTEVLEQKYEELFADIKKNQTTPLLVEIPDRHGTGRKENFISDYMKEVIGIKL